MCCPSSSAAEPTAVVDSVVVVRDTRSSVDIVVGTEGVINVVEDVHAVGCDDNGYESSIDNDDDLSSDDDPDAQHKAAESDVSTRSIKHFKLTTNLLFRSTYINNCMQSL